MKYLMKYEFRKTAFIKLIILGIAALAEIVFLAGLYGGDERVLAAGVLILTLLASGSLTVIGVASVVILHRDMNTKQSYMLFMTPNSSYRILGAKYLENGLSILLTGAFFFALGALDITLLFAHKGQLESLWQMIRDMLATIDSRLTLDMPTMISFTFGILAAWISTVACAYLGVVISTALLAGRRFSGLISIIFILLLFWVTGWLGLKIAGLFNDVRTSFLMEGLAALFLSAVMYVLTARIMETRLSV